jgi:carboxymethylenebutenolidase
MRAPLLLLVAGEDFTPQEEFQAFDQELTTAGVPHKMVVYPGAPHSFFDRAHNDFTDECADAWTRTLRFLESVG